MPFGADQLLVAGVDGPFALWLESSCEGALGGMLHFFLQYPLSALHFGTALTRFTDEIFLAIPNIMFVLVVPSFVCSRVGSGGFRARLLYYEGLEIGKASLLEKGLRVWLGSRVLNDHFEWGWGWYL